MAKQLRTQSTKKNMIYLSLSKIVRCVSHIQHNKTQEVELLPLTTCLHYKQEQGVCLGLLDYGSSSAHHWTPDLFTKQDAWLRVSSLFNKKKLIIKHWARCFRLNKTPLIININISLIVIITNPTDTPYKTLWINSRSIITGKIRCLELDSASCMMHNYRFSM